MKAGLKQIIFSISLLLWGAFLQRMFMKIYLLVSQQSAQPHALQSDFVMPYTETEKKMMKRATSKV